MAEQSAVSRVLQQAFRCAFVLPAGLLYRYRRTRSGALLGSLVGASTMAVCSFPLNLYLVYPVYERFMPIDQILAAYQALLPSMDSLWKCLLVFNLPFTLVKGLAATLLAFLVYKPLSRFIKGTA